MRVLDIMSSRPVVVPATARLGLAARLLAEHEVTALPVVDHRGRLVGMISELDVITCDGLSGVVDDVMRSAIVLVHPETEVAEVSRILGATRLKSLPVVDAADHVVGVVSRSDVVRALARDDEALEQDVADVLARVGVGGCEIRVRNGIVELIGSETVTRRPELSTVVDAVAGMPGVSAVHVIASTAAPTTPPAARSASARSASAKE